MRNLIQRLRYVAFIVSVLCLTPIDAQEIGPLPQAHAHNDYLHTKPLLDALGHGFCSVEADIFLQGDQLLVAHTKSEIDTTRTLQSLYLNPLRDRIRNGGGKVYANGAQLTLLIDIKSPGQETYEVLDRVLSEYGELFAHVENGQYSPGPVVAIISGNRPIQSIASDSTRYAGIDGRISDLDTKMDSRLLPLISDNWTTHFRWRGTGDMSMEELSKLRSIVAKAHAADRRVRFWATPDTPTVWRLLRDEKVDLINTDSLQGLSEFLASKSDTPSALKKK